MGDFLTAPSTSSGVISTVVLTCAVPLDRLTHHAHIVELTGESFRFRQRMQAKDV